MVARALTAKVLKEKNIKKDSEEGENIKKEFLNLADKIAKTIPMDPGTTLTSCMEDLKILFSDDAIAMQLIDLALLIEGSVTNTGTHAAGIIITDKPVKNYIALTYDTENKVYKTQCDMVEAEGIHGLLKFDFLGLRTLSTLTYAARQLYHDKGIYVDFDKIPVEPEVIDPPEVNKHSIPVLFKLHEADYRPNQTRHICRPDYDQCNRQARPNAVHYTNCPSESG